MKTKERVEADINDTKERMEGEKVKSDAKRESEFYKKYESVSIEEERNVFIKIKNVLNKSVINIL